VVSLKVPVTTDNRKEKIMVPRNKAKQIQTERYRVLNAYDDPTNSSRSIVSNEIPWSDEHIDFDLPCEVGAVFDSGSMRSEKKLPFWRLPKRALVEWAKRFQKGVKYDEKKGMTHNWKLAIGTDDIEFVRQFFDHAFEHMLNAKDLAQKSVNHPDSEGETVMDHLGAAMWNIAALIEYVDKDPELVCLALSQEPVNIVANKT
jgi:hypothetical protein